MAVRRSPEKALYTFWYIGLSHVSAGDRRGRLRRVAGGDGNQEPTALAGKVRSAATETRLRLMDTAALIPRIWAAFLLQRTPLPLFAPFRRDFAAKPANKRSGVR
ncbi:hypothetical protein ACFPES_28635 [Paenibacillus sp. GCM10023248]|nr:hypothetical protein [Paenibacillus sp. MAHUQ-63]